MNKNNFIKIGQTIRNIYNQEEIKFFIDEIINKKKVSNTLNSHLYNWLNHNLKNYLLSNHNTEKITDISNLKNELWVIHGFKNNTLSNVLLDTELRNQVEHIVDYYLFINPKKSLNKVSFFDALHKSISWSNSHKKVKDDPSGIEKFLNFDDGFSIVKIKSDQAIDYESSQMNHCLSLTYKESIKNNQKQVFSIRDSKNVPHVTILLDNSTNNITEVKGNSNTIVKIEYQKYLVNLFNNLSFQSIDHNEFKSLSNINFNEKIGQFEFVNNIINKNYNFNLNIKNMSVTQKIFYRHISEKKHTDNFFNFNFYKDSLFFNVSLFDIDNSDLLKINNFNIKNLNITYNDYIINLSNNHIENLNITLNKEIFLTNINLNIPNSKTLQLQAPLIQQTPLPLLDLSNSKLETIILENINLNNLILPSTLKSLTMINSKILNSNLLTIDCKKIITSCYDIPLKADNIVLIDNNDFHNDLILQNDIQCKNLYTNFTITNINQILNKNIFAYNGYKINSFTNQTDNFNPLKLLYSNDSYKTNHITEQFFDITIFNLNDLSDFISSHIIFRNITVDQNIFIEHDDINLLFRISSNFSKLPIKEQKEIFLYETLYLIKNGEISLNDIESILIEPSSITLKNHINIKKQDPNYTDINRILTDTEKENKKQDPSSSRKLRHNMINSLDSKTIAHFNIDTNDDKLSKIVNSNKNFYSVLNDLDKFGKTNCYFITEENILNLTEKFFKEIIFPKLSKSLKNNNVSNKLIYSTIFLPCLSNEFKILSTYEIPFYKKLRNNIIDMFTKLSADVWLKENKNKIKP